MPTVLILGGRAPVALDHARRFAHQGWRVVVGDSIPCRISGASCAVTTTVRLAAPRDDLAGFAGDLVGAITAHDIDLVLPTCEEVFYVARCRPRFPAHVRVLADDFEKLRAMHSKWSFLALAQGCGAIVPDATLVDNLGEARRWADSTAVVLKPEFSRFGVNVRIYPDGIPDDARPLEDRGRWVAQRFAAGTEFASYSVASAGRLLAHSLYRPSYRLRRSSSFYFEHAGNDVIRTFVERFVEKLDFTGQVSFDWIVDAAGDATVLECNPRTTSGCHLFGPGDALPSALEGASMDCIEPSIDRPKMIGAMMGTVGLVQALRAGTFARAVGDFLEADDVIGIRGDRRPVLGAIGDLLSYARIGRAQGCNLREAATRDIEWDGQPLPAP